MVAGPFAGIDERRPPFAWIPVSILLLLLLPAFGSTPARAQAPGYCFPAATHLCLNGGRFQVDVDWMLPNGPGKGQAVPLTADTGLFWFFGNSNLELIVKVLDGRPVNGHFWVYYGGLSDVEYRITLTDTKTGAREIYTNPVGQLASGSDTSAFDAEPPSAAGPGLPGGTGEAPPLLRLGEELRANVTTEGLQNDPSVAVAPGGVSMVTWSGPPPPQGPGDAGNVYGRFYDRAGNPLGGEVRLNAAPAGFQFSARVAASPTGGFMAVWNDENRVAGRLYGADGQPLGGEIGIGALAGFFEGRPAIVGDPAGGFLVGWPSTGSGGSLRLQRFSAQGSRVGNEIELLRGGSGLGLAASPVPGGGFLISWIDSFDGVGTDVRVLRLDASARPVGTALWANIDAVRHGGYQAGTAPVFHAGGGFSVLWTNFVLYGQSGVAGLFARRYSAGGEPAGGVITLLQRESAGYLAPAAVVLPSGAALVLWYESGRIEDLDGGTFGRLYDPSWQPVGGEFRVNTFTQALQGAPAVAADSSGTLFTAWQSGRDPSPFIPLPGEETEGQDGSYFGIYAQRFTTTSCATDSARQLCLNGRFRVEVRFVDPRSNLPGAGRAVPLTSDTGGFWFFDASNAELMIKILDGRALNGHFWVFAGALSDVEYTITVTDTQTGMSKVYHNAPNQLTSRADTTDF